MAKQIKPPKKLSEKKWLQKPTVQKCAKTTCQDKNYNNK